MSERIEIAGMPCLIVEAMPQDVVIIVPSLTRKPLESDAEYDRRRGRGAIKITNLGKARG